MASFNITAIQAPRLFTLTEHDLRALLRRATRQMQLTDADDQSLADGFIGFAT